MKTGSLNTKTWRNSIWSLVDLRSKAEPGDRARLFHLECINFARFYCSSFYTCFIPSQTKNHHYEQ